MSTPESSNEPLFIYPDNDSPALRAAHAQAKASLPQFAAVVNKQRTRGASCNVKIHFPEPDGSEGSHIWLAVNELFGDMYFCSARELPSGFEQLKLGQTLVITAERIEDWMILADGSLYGGYSLRVLRELPAPDERVRFDDHIGVLEYRDGVP